MRKFSALALIAFGGAFIVGLSLSAPNADARPGYPKLFVTKYGKLKDQVTEAKCGVCHPGMDKKIRNDYGMAIAKALGEEKNVKDQDVFDKALDAAAKEKNEKGETFGSLIEAGKLPGTKKSE